MFAIATVDGPYTPEMQAHIVEAADVRGAAGLLPDIYDSTSVNGDKATDHSPSNVY